MNELLAGIGQRISGARKSKKMMREALAELAGVSHQTISSAELGKSFAAGEHDEDPSGAAGFHGLLADRQSKYKDLPSPLPVRRKRAGKAPREFPWGFGSARFCASRWGLRASRRAGKAGPGAVKRMPFGERAGPSQFLI